MANRGNVLGEMWGEHAVQCPFILVAGSANLPDQERSKFGGAALSNFCIQDKKWERWQGTMILIPTRIEIFTAKPGYERIDQMMVGPMIYGDLWKKVWP